MRRNLGIALAIGVLTALAVAGPASADRVKPTIRFFSGAQDDAHWTPKDSVDPNRMSIELEVGPADLNDPTTFGYAGFELNHVEGTPPPAEEPGFWHKEDRVSAFSGGSPRLVIFFANGRMELRPEQWTTSWQEVGNNNDDGNWDVNGGTCGFLFDTDYETGVACFAGQPVTAVIMVTDSNWMADKATGYINWIDQLQYDGFIYSHASDNNNSSN